MAKIIEGEPAFTATGMPIYDVISGNAIVGCVEDSKCPIKGRFFVPEGYVELRALLRDAGQPKSWPTLRAANTALARI